MQLPKALVRRRPVVLTKFYTDLVNCPLDVKFPAGCFFIHTLMRASCLPENPTFHNMDPAISTMRITFGMYKF